MLELLREGAVALLGWLVMVALWKVRQARMRRRLEDLDSGKRCLVCNATEVEVAGDVARCRRCGHAASLAKLRSTRVSDRRIATVTRPGED